MKRLKTEESAQEFIDSMYEKYHTVWGMSREVRESIRQAKETIFSLRQERDSDG